MDPEERLTMKLHILIDSGKILGRVELKQILSPLERLPGEKEIALLEPRFTPPGTGEGKLLRFYSTKDFLRHLKGRIAANGTAEQLLRIRTMGHPIPEDLPRKFLEEHLSRKDPYTLADGGRVMLYELSLEALDLKGLPLREFRLFPDGTLDVPPELSHNYFLDREDVAFYLRDHFGEFYGGPRNIMVEVSTQCNLLCGMCFYFAPRKGSGLFDSPSSQLGFSVFKETLDRVYGRFGNYPNIDFNGRGEPLLNPELPEMISYAKARGFYCSMSTNATLLSHETSRRLIDAGLDTLAVSLDASDGETYQAIRRGGDYDGVVKNIQGFLDCRAAQKEQGPELVVKMILQPANGYDYRRFVETWRPLADRMVIWGDCLPSEAGNGAGFKTSPFEGYDACTSLWGNLAVTLEGRIYPCCLICTRRAFDSPMGDAREIGSCWTGEEMRKGRELTLEERSDELPFCKGCQWKSISASLTRSRVDGLFVKTFYNMIHFQRNGR
jgi:MoaA/NifB/PqqE/SkfB family radical SAM enzyme